jgi:Na+/proline symporter
MSIDDPEQLKYSAVVGTIWNVLMAVGAIMIGLIGRVYFPEVSLLPGSDTENLYPVLAQQQLHPVLFGIVTASIFAAIMSTADSQLLVAASGIVRDIYEKLVRKNETIEQKRLVLLSRIVVIILVIVALVLGMLMQQLIFWLVLFAWAGLGASLGPTSILSLYWKNVTRNGIFAGLFTGAIVTFLWYNIPILKAAMYELIPAFIISFAVIIIVSKFSSKPTDIERAFETMQSNTFKG